MILRKYEIRWKLSDTTAETFGKGVAADLAARPLSGKNRFMRRKSAEWFAQRLHAGLCWSEKDQPLTERVWGHLDAVVVDRTKEP